MEGGGGKEGEGREALFGSLRAPDFFCGNTEKFRRKCSRWNQRAKISLNLQQDETESHVFGDAIKVNMEKSCLAVGAKSYCQALWSTYYSSLLLKIGVAARFQPCQEYVGVFCWRARDIKARWYHSVAYWCCGAAYCFVRAPGVYLFVSFQRDTFFVWPVLVATAQISGK